MAVDIDMMNQSQIRALLGTQADQKKYEQVIYYRAPQETMMGKPAKNAGWIDWGDSQSSKRAVMLERGWVPLPKFGAIEKSDDPWAPILSHPDGPALFPVSQILSNRWYDVAQLKEQWPSMPSGTKPARLFRQLVGVRIVQYFCPQCTDRTLPTATGLYQHLHVHHGYDPKDIFAYGETVGIDFSLQLKGRAIRDFTVEAEEAEPEEEDVELDIVGMAGPAPLGRTAGRPRDRLGHLLPGKPVRPEDDD